MARHLKNDTAVKKQKGVQLYRILPVFRTSLLPVLGFLATHRVTKAFDANPTPEHWLSLFKNELEWQITAALRSGLLNEEQINRLADTWLTVGPANEVIGTPLEHKAEIFAELAVAGGMLIDPQSPFQLALDFLQARKEGAQPRQEEIVLAADDRSYETRVTTSEFLSFNPLDRLEMMLANMALRGPSGGAPTQIPGSLES